jgi:hypothetical protein
VENEKNNQKIFRSRKLPKVLPEKSIIEKLGPYYKASCRKF